MQTQRRAGRLFHRSGGQEVIEMRVSVQNAHHRQSQRTHLLQDALRRPSRINHDRLLRERISDDRTITTKRRNRKGLANHALLMTSNQNYYAKRSG